MTDQIKHHTFDPFDPTSILGFLKTFKLASDTSSIHGGAALLLSHFSMYKSTYAVLTGPLGADFTDRCTSHKTTVRLRYLTTYPQVVNFWSKKYASNDLIADTESAIIRFPNQSGMTMAVR